MNIRKKKKNDIEKNHSIHLDFIPCDFVNNLTLTASISRCMVFAVFSLPDKISVNIGANGCN